MNPGKLFASSGQCDSLQRRARTNRRIAMMIEALATATPVLAAGWSLLYLLFGGGLGGAVIIFVALKAIGR
jgi:hypothetical protein